MAQVLAFIKAHSFALACAVVALVGLVAYFAYPIPGMFDTLRSDVQGREAVHSSLRGLLDAQRTLPVVSLEPDAQPKPLDAFPTRRVIDQGKKMLVSLSDESKRVLETVVRRNERKPLVPEALPNGGPISRQLFLDRYKIETAQIGEHAERGIVRRVLKGALPPSAEELQIIGDRRAAQITSTMLQYGPNNQPMNQPQVDAMIAAMRAQLPLQQRMERAFRSMIYVSPDAVEIHPTLRGTQLPDPTTVFNGQLSLWMQHTAFEALVDANQGAKNVFDAPVKHLVRLQVPMNYVNAPAAGPIGFGAPEGDPSAAPVGPAELKPDAAAIITPSYGHNPLGYTHNALYDPIPMNLIVRVDVRKLPQVLASLQTARLIKVKNVNFRTVDTGRALSEGYIYDRDGKTPLVDVAIEADVLLLRQWLVAYMSDPVKRFFASLSSPAAPQS